MRLRRVTQGNGVSVYKVSDEPEGDTYLLKPVDREYQGRAHPPKYYLSRKLDGGGAQYISGVFPTEDSRVFSLDMRDSLGVKIPWRLVFFDGGAEAILEQGRASHYRGTGEPVGAKDRGAA